MEESVTLKLGRYEALRDKSRLVDVLEKENGRLKKELVIARKQLEELQQPGEKEPTDMMDTPEPEDEINTKITLDVIEFENMCKENEELKEMNEYLKMRLSNVEYLYEYKVKNEEEKCVGTIGKQDTENYKNPDELLIELIQKQGLHATQLQIKELLNRQSRD